MGCGKLCKPEGLTLVVSCLNDVFVVVDCCVLNQPIGLFHYCLCLQRLLLHHLIIIVDCCVFLINQMHRFGDCCMLLAVPAAVDIKHCDVASVVVAVVVTASAAVTACSAAVVSSRWLLLLSSSVVPVVVASLLKE